MQAGLPVVPAFRGPVIIHLRTTTTHGRILGAKEARSCEIGSKRANPLISSPRLPSRHMKLWRAAYTATRARRVRVCVPARRQNASLRSEAGMLITPASSAARKDRGAPTATSSLPASQSTPSSHQLTFHRFPIGPKVINLKCRIEFHSTQKVNTEMKLIQIASRFCNLYCEFIT